MSNFSDLLSRMLSNVSSARDKRQSSIIYNALSPMAVELAQMHIIKAIFEEQSYLLAATGINLENWAANFDIARKQATYAVRIAKMNDTSGNPLDLPIGSRFSQPNVTGGLNFILTANTGTPGECLLTCETAGTIGNAYLGNLLPLFVINNLGSAVMIGTQTPAEDTETDDELRERVIARIKQEAFGGNVADYKEFATDIDGVGDVKVFPVWDGGGTVMLSIVDGEYLPVSTQFISVVQAEIDPISNSGEGLGMAPIGHRVTVTTPSSASIRITATVSLQADYTISQLQASIERAIKDYILEVRRDWSSADSITLYVARIISAIIGIQGVNNVADVTINGGSIDLTLMQSPALQQVPVFGSVVLTSA